MMKKRGAFVTERKKQLKTISFSKNGTRSGLKRSKKAANAQKTFERPSESLETYCSRPHKKVFLLGSKI